MKKLQWLTCACFGAFLFSCGNDVKKETVSGEAKKDSVAKTENRQPVAESLYGDTLEPRDPSLVLFRFDEKLSGRKPVLLKAGEVRKRFWPLDKTADPSALFTFARYFELDSIRKTGKEYEGDVGDIMQVDIDVLDTLKNAGPFCAVAWRMHFVSYEACPFSSGDYFMITTYGKDGKAIRSYMIAQDISGADAPVFFHSQQRTNVYTDGTFRSCSTDTMGDEGEDKPVYGVVKTVSTGRIDPAGMIFSREISRDSTGTFDFN
ncbi:MAG TPA: hypothetical protein VFU15_05835 [Bacteroidia bacterium]|nr:hypothetical protein [Bacteroidia bacterium]